MKTWLLILAMALVGTNFVWAVAYRALWYDAAQAEGLLDEAEHYIRDGR